MLLSLNDYKDYINIPLTDTSLDTKLTSLINGIESQMCSFLRRNLALADVTEYFDGDGTNEYITNEFPINSIAKIEKRDIGADTFTEITDENIYDFRTGNVILISDNVFEIGQRNYKIIYNTGYSTQNMPYDLALALKKLVMLAYKDSGFGDSRLGVSSKVRGGQSAQFQEFIDKKEPERIYKSVQYHRNINA